MSTPLQTQVRQIVATLLAVDAETLSVDGRLKDQGLESVHAAALVEALSTLVGRTLPATLPWSCPTLRALVAYLEGDEVDDGPAARAPTAPSREAIAIVGVGCRFPMANGPEAFWELLTRGTDAVRAVPRERWDGEAWFDEAPEAPGKARTRRGGFLDDVAGFDAAFFGIAPREAREMDPQQRLFLETALEALEHAGVQRDTLRGSRTGVYVGSMWRDWERVVGSDPERVARHTATGQDPSILAARVSYWLGTRGPSLAINTACSSSLVAVHLAVQSLLRGEIDCAIAGAVNLMLDPRGAVVMSKFGAMAPDGRCKAFDARADGYVRGEGVGAVVLTRLSDALDRGDRILAVVAGTAVNNDGFSNGLTAPSAAAQRAVLREAWQSAGIPTADVQYVETHGPGTLLGDPIEADALVAAFGPRAPEERLVIGSVKTNLGHLEAAAGMAGLLKTTLALHHGQIPQNLHFEIPNPHVDFDSLRVPTTLEPWPDGPRRAGVSSFGFGGTNAHVALCDAPGVRTPASLTAGDGGRRVVFVFGGQGGQWVGMGQDLWSRFPAFRSALEEVDAALEPVWGSSACETVLRPGDLGSPAQVQPLVFAFQVAAARLLEHLGLVPDAVIGQSMGEVAAAVVAGHLALGDGARVIVERSRRVTEQIAGTGSMAVVDASPESLALPDGLVVAGRIGRETTLVAGAPDAIEAWIAAATRAGRRVTPVKVTYASHCAGVEPVLPGLRSALQDVRGLDGGVPWWSTARHRWMTAGEADGAYWIENLREPFDLVRGAEQACGDEPALVVEIGPHPVLTHPLAETLGTAHAISHVAHRSGGALVHLSQTLGTVDARVEPVRPAPATRLLPVSAPDPERLIEAADALAAVLEREPLDAVVQSAWHRSTPLPVRAAVVAADAEEARRALACVGRQTDAAVVEGRALPASPVAFVFPGQGGQWEGMGRALLDTSPAFADRLRACDAAIEPLTGWRVEHVLRGRGSSLARIDVVQPVLWATMVSLAAWWRSMGVEPAAVVGHSQGELAAAVVGGALDLEDAARVVVRRSELLATIAGNGAMAVVGRDPEALELPEALAVAVVNGPGSCVVAGPPSVLDPWLAEETARGTYGKRVEVDVSSHTAAVDGLAEPLAHALAGLAPRAGRVAMVSTVTGEEVPGEHLDSDYWFDNLRQPVRFDRALQTLVARGVTTFVEISPHPLLRTVVEQALERAGVPGVAVGSLRRDQGGVDALLHQLGALHVAGGPGCPPREPQRPVDLPRTRLARERFWPDATPSTAGRTRIATPDGAELVYRSVGQADGAWIEEHRVRGEAWVPAAALLVWVGEACQRIQGDGVLTDFVLTRPLVWNGPFELVVRFVPGGSGFGVEVHALRDGTWSRHAEGRLRTRPSPAPLVQGVPGDGAAPYARWADRGLVYGPRFRALEALAVEGSRVNGRLSPSPALSPTARRIVALDAALQSVLVGQTDAHLQVPLAFDEVHLDASLPQQVVAVGEADGRWALDAGGWQVRGIRLGRVDRHTIDHAWVTSWAAVAPTEERDPAIVPTIWRRPDLREAVAELQAAVEARQALVWVTFGATGDAPGCEEAAALWGLGRVAQREHPQLALRLVDLVDVDVDALPPALGVSGEDQLRVDGDGVWALRLMPASIEPIDNEPARTVLITGGSGHVGGVVGRWLLTTGRADRVVLASRSVPAVELAPRLEHRVCDVTDPDAVRALVQSLPDLDVVVHGAMVLDDQPVTGLTHEALERVWAPKVVGAQNLEAAVGPQIRLVLLSSMASILGNPGQGAYAAANAWLDAMARRRTAAGGTTQALQWGLWENQARALSPSALQRYTGDGFHAWSDAQAMERLALVWDGGPPELLLVEADWRRFREGAATSTRALVPATPIRPEQEPLEAVVRRELLAVLGHPPDRALDPHLGFAVLGLDSLMALTLRERLEGRLGVELPATVALNHPTLSRLTAFLEGSSERPVRQRRTPSTGGGPIAIVGVGLRLPTGARSVASLWQALVDGVDGVGEIPSDRMDIDAWFDADPAAPGRSYSRWAGLVEGVGSFDAASFDIAPREARSLDPQQALLLEVSQEALDDAGWTASAIRDAEMGVFVGALNHDHDRRLLAESDLAWVDSFTASGTRSSPMAGRLSHHFALRGPSLTVDTACSSSLTALHLAVRALRSGECETALVAGVNALLSPLTLVERSKNRMLSPTGRCRPFDASADGIAIGEGCVVVALKPLDRALADGDRIHTVVAGTAMNHDGHTSGLTVPSGPAQERVLRAALLDAGVEPETVGFVEAHGTGTPLGDPIELDALRTVYRGASDAPLWVGSVKSNLGHLEAAAGLAGLVKAALALRHGTLPPSLHFDQGNPHVDWEGPLQVPTGPTPLEGRVGAVSSFGFSGTNVHVVLEAPPITAPSAEQGEGPHLLVLSARTEATLRDTMSSWEQALADGTLPLASACATAALRRSHLAWRTVAVGKDAQEIAQRLVKEPLVQAAERPAVTLVFTGQGSPWRGMGAGLLELGVARSAIEQVDALVRAAGAPSVLDDLVDGDLTSTTRAQPALFALQVGVVAWLRDVGVPIAGALGHSVGEIAAAWAMGGLSLEEATRLVVERARAMACLDGSGGLLAVALPPSEVEPLLRDGLELSAHNAPEGVVVGGPVAALEVLEHDLRSKDVFTRRLEVSCAFHTAVCAPASAALGEALGTLRTRTMEGPLYSTLLGRRVEGHELATPHWTAHIRQPVRFVEAVEAAMADGARVFLEVGPHPALGRALKAIAPDIPGVGTLRRGAETLPCLLQAVGRLHAHGVPVPLQAVVEDAPVTSLPPRVWQHDAHVLYATSAAPSSETPAPVEKLDLDGLGRADREEVLRVWLEERVRAALLWPAERPLDSDAGLFSLGMDSIVAVDLVATLGAALDRSFPKIFVFEHNSIEALAREVAREPRSAPVPPPPPPPEPFAGSEEADLLAELKALLDTPPEASP